MSKAFPNHSVPSVYGPAIPESNESPKNSSQEQVAKDKKEALHQETLRKRNLRKATRNKALAVAKNKYERRRVAKGTTAQELLNSYPAVKVQRARTLRREEQRQLKKLSRQFSTKRVNPNFPKIIVDETAKSE